MSRLKTLALCILAASVAWTGYEALRNSAVEKIPARDRSLQLNVNGNSVLRALENGEPYDPRILDDIATYTSRRFDTSDFRLQSLARILYRHSDSISASEKKYFSRILRGLAGRPVLTVSDSDDFLEAGGMIRLVTRADRVRWEINRHQARAAGLNLAAKLYYIAVRVLDRPASSRQGD